MSTAMSDTSTISDRKRESKVDARMCTHASRIRERDILDHWLNEVQDCRALGDSWPKAVRETIEFSSRIGWHVVKFGQAISKVGAKIVPGGI